MPARFLCLLAFLAASAALSPALAQVLPKQLAAPPADFLAGQRDLPSPADSATTSPGAMIPVTFQRMDNRWVWTAQIPIDDARELRLMPLAPDSVSWRLTATPPASPPISLARARAPGPWRIDQGTADLGALQVPATRAILFDQPAGLWTLTIEADAARGTSTEGYLLIRTARDTPLQTSLTTHRLLVGSPIALEARMPAGSTIDSAIAILRAPGAPERTIDLPIQAGTATFQLTPQREGEHTILLIAQGHHADGSPFIRSTTHALPILPDTLTLGPIAHIASEPTGQWAVQLPLSRCARTQRVIASAQVWGTAPSGEMAPVCWLSTIAEPKPDAKSITLHLDERWLALAAVGAPLELRAVRVQDADTAIPLDTAPLIPLASDAPLRLRAHAPGRITPDMLTGRPRPDLALPSRAEPSPQRARAFAGHNLMLVHGYCSEGVWPTNQFTGGVEVFLDANQSRSHDQFANLMLDFGSASKSYGIIAHSQGGAAALHLATFYFSGLDWAEGPRPIQSVGTPYQGTPLAGNLAVLGQLFGTGCGTNFDLSTDGAALWLANIPSASRARVSYYTTSFTDDGGFDYCNFVSDFFLSDPDDGVIERARGQLPGATNMGHTTGWCHSQGMRDPAQYLDASRNATMNASAAR